MDTFIGNMEISVQKIDTCYLCGSAGTVLFKKEMEDRLFGVPGTWSYKRCNACGLNWLTPWPENLSKAYINYYTHAESENSKLPLKKVIRYVKNCVAAAAFGYTEKINRKPEYILGRLLARVGLLKEISGRSLLWLKGEHRGRLLDVGCGSGMFLAHMQNFGWQVTGIDPDPDAVVTAKKNFGLQDIQTGSLDSVEFAENSFDSVTMNHVLEHLPDPIKTLNQSWLILRPGGQLVVTTPNVKSLGKRLFKKHWRGWEPPRHLFLFDSKTLGMCAEKAGFLTHSIQIHATSAFDIFTSSRLLQKKIALPCTTPQNQPRIIIFQAIGFWILEYLLNCVWPCGEELVMSAHKPLD